MPPLEATRPSRLRGRRVLVVVAVLLLGWAVAAAVMLASAARDLDSGRDEASRAADRLDPETLLDGDVVEPLERAGRHFSSAHDRLRSPVVSPLRLLPVVGRHVRSLDALSATASTLADATGEALDRSATLARRAPTTGEDRIQVVAELLRTVRVARRRVDPLELGPRTALVGPVAEARADLADQVAKAERTLRSADEGLTLMDRILRGPSRYLVVAANNAEMRAGSGMWLVGGVLTTNDGRMDLGPMASLYEVAQPAEGTVTIEDADLLRNWGWMDPQDDWRNLMTSPRLPVGASLGTRMWLAAGQPAIDGILVVDAVALGDLVRATGPVTVDGRTYDADGIVQELLHDQYLRFVDQARGARQDALADVADAAFGALDAGRWDTADLVDQLARAVRGRHLLAWSPDPAEERGWTAASMSGQLGRDSLAVSLLNRGGNKLDWYTYVTSELRTQREGSKTLVTAKISVINRSPEREPEYVIGPFPGAETVAGEYKGELAVNVPAAATGIEMSGASAGVYGPDGPTSVVSGQVRVRRGATVTVTVRFRMPGHHGRLRLEPSARQPGIAWTVGSKQWYDDRARNVGW